MNTTQRTAGIEQDFASEVQRFDTTFLVAIHHGEINVATLARRELMHRGLSGDGRWLGFAKAGELLKL